MNKFRDGEGVGGCWRCYLRGCSAEARPGCGSWLAGLACYRESGRYVTRCCSRHSLGVSIPLTPARGPQLTASGTAVRIYSGLWIRWVLRSHLYLCILPVSVLKLKFTLLTSRVVTSGFSFGKLCTDFLFICDHPVLRASKILDFPKIAGDTSKIRTPAMWSRLLTIWIRECYCNG